MLHIGNPIILKSRSLSVCLLDDANVSMHMNDSESDVCVCQGVYIILLDFLLMVVDSALDCTITFAYKRKY